MQSLCTYIQIYQIINWNFRLLRAECIYLWSTLMGGFYDCAVVKLWGYTVRFVQNDRQNAKVQYMHVFVSSVFLLQEVEVCVLTTVTTIIQSLIWLLIITWCYNVPDISIISVTPYINIHWNAMPIFRHSSSSIFWICKWRNHESWPMLEVITSDIK